MKRYVIATLLGLAAAAVALPAHALSPDEARHLLLRTGFGATPQQIRALEPMDRARAVRTILDATVTEAVTPPPAFMANTRPDWPAHYRSTDEEAKMAFNKARDAEAVELKAWWYAEMIATPSPFTERMVLFWHNHFTSSMDKVRHTDLLFRQNALFRQTTTGSFRTLVHAVAKDPAMVRYLDSQANRKAAPNENFARELLELYTLGEGRYSEKDIREAARAFTGWHMNDTDGQFRFNKGQHDDGVKTVLGKTGKFDGGDVIDIILARPDTAVFMTAKLWREFVSDTPDAAEVSRLAKIYRDSDYDTRAVLEAIFAAPAFWAAEQRGALIKSPVELLVGTVRSFEIPIADTTPFVEYGRRLRQDIFNPPNVKGWPGGTWWISTYTLLERREVVLRLLNGSDLGAAPGSGGMGSNSMGGSAMGGGMTATPAATKAPGAAPAPGIALWVDAHGTLAASPEAAAKLLLAAAPVEPPVGKAGRTMIEALVLDPAYQVK